MSNLPATRMSHVAQKTSTYVTTHNDYLRKICEYLRITEIFVCIPSISKYHYEFINSLQQKKLLERCLNYESKSNYDRNKTKKSLKVTKAMEQLNLNLKYGKEDDRFKLSLSQQVELIVKVIQV